MKLYQTLLLFLLSISILFAFISCDGYGYTISISYEELVENLMSAEIVVGYQTGEIEIVRVLDIVKVKCDLFEKISEKDIKCQKGPREYDAIYGLRLIYPNQTLILDEFTIYHFNASGEFSKFGTKSHMINASNNEYKNSISAFLNENLSTIN